MEKISKLLGNKRMLISFEYFVLPSVYRILYNHRITYTRFDVICTHDKMWLIYICRIAFADVYVYINVLNEYHIVISNEWKNNCNLKLMNFIFYISCIVSFIENGRGETN